MDKQNRWGRNTRRLLTLVAIELLWSLSPTGVFAQRPPPDSVVSLGDLTIFIRREFGLIGGASAIAYSPGSMNLPPIATAEDALREMPLVTVRQNSRGQAEISLRGSESRQVAVLVDGIPLTLSWDARTDPSLLPLMGAERIEVIRGLSTLLTGPNVLGGLIDISLGRYSSNARAIQATHWTMGVDQEGGYSFGGSVIQPVEGSDGSWIVRGGVGLRSRPGVPIPDGVTDETGTEGRRTNSYLDQINGFGAVRYMDTGGRWFSVSASGQSSERGVPPELHVLNPRLWQYPDEWSGFVSASAGTSTIDTRWGTGEIEFNLGVHGGRQEIASFSTRSYDEIADTEVGEDRTLSSRLMAKHSLGTDHSLNTAFTFAQINHRELLGTSPSSNYVQRIWSLAAETQWTVAASSRLAVSGALDGATTVEAGGRETLGVTWAPAGRIGITAPISGRPIALHGAISSRARFPALRELYSGALGRFEPNPDLKPERLFAAEGGATFGDGAIDVQLVGFYHKLTDAIVRTSTPHGKFKRINQNELETTGIELLLGFAAGRFEVDGDATFQHASLRGLGEPVQPEHTPQFRGGFDIEVPVFQTYLVRGRVEYQGEMYCVHPDLGTDVNLSGNGRADVSIEKTFQIRSAGRLSKLRGRTSLRNALDSTSYDQCGMPQPGRTLSFAIELF